LQRTACANREDELVLSSAIDACSEFERDM
jgi:hypothetical protein